MRLWARELFSICVVCVLAGAFAHAAPANAGASCSKDPASCAGTKSGPADAIKWHPGQYMSMRNSHRYDRVDLGYISELANEPTVIGVLRDWRWGDIEDERGVYDFSEIDKYLQALKALPTPKRFIIRIEDRAFGNQKSSVVPDYMRADPAYLGGQAPMGSGVVARIWEAPVMDRLIALYQALGARYDAEPLVEGISTSETAIGFNKDYPAPATYSTGALLTQLKRLIAAERLAWPHSNVFAETNYLGSNSQMEDFISFCVDQQAVIGGPDVVPERALQSDEIMRGELGAAKDYRGIVAIKAEVQASSLGERWTITPSDLYAQAYSTDRSNYIFWDRNDFYGNAAEKWTTGILPFIRSVNGQTVSACPKSFHDKCMTN
jgi:hypothetical protein